LTIAKDWRGKPYFAGAPHLFFSLSHSGAYAACAFATHPVGLDLQEHRHCSREAVARRFFHPREYEWLKERDFAPFFSVWTAKESYLKYTGAGIAGGLAGFSVVDDKGLKAAMECTEIVHSETPGEVTFFYRTYPVGYSLCLCAACRAYIRIVER